MLIIFCWRRHRPFTAVQFFIKSASFPNDLRDASRTSCSRFELRLFLPEHFQRLHNTKYGGLGKLKARDKLST
jgi:hypothetical protein